MNSSSSPGSSSRPTSVSGGDDDPFSLDALKQLTDPKHKRSDADPDIIDLGLLASSTPGSVAVTRVVAPPSLAQIAAPVAGVPNPNARPSLMSRLWPAFAVAAIVAVGGGFYFLRSARAAKPTLTTEAPAAAPVASAQPAESAAPVAPTAAESASAAPAEPEEPAVAAIVPGQHIANAPPAAATGDGAQAQAPVRVAPKRSVAKSAPKPAAPPKPPVDACDLQCQMRKAVSKRH